MLSCRFLWKLYAGYALLIVFTMMGVGLLVSNWLESELVQSVQDDLRTQAVLLRDMAREALQEHAKIADEERARAFRSEFAKRLVALSGETHTDLTVVRGDGEVLADSERSARGLGNLGERPEIREASRSGIAVHTDDIEDKVVLAMELRTPEGGRLGYLRTSIPLAHVDLLLSGLRREVFLGALLSCLAALGLGFLIARRITRRLLSLAEATEAFSAGDHARRVREDSRDEIGRLARAFNAMADGIAGQFSTIDHDRKQLRAILGSMVEGVIAVDTSGCVLHINQVAAKILRIRRGEATGRSLREITRVREICEVLDRALADGHDAHRECQISGGPSEPIVQMHASPLRVGPSGITGAVVVLHDVTELRKYETMRRDFVANVSHELKTPLTAIQGFAETIRDDPEMDPGLRERFIGKIHAQSNRLNALVADLLVLSRFESEDDALKTSDIDLRLPLLRAKESLQPLMESKSIEFVLSLPDEQVIGACDASTLEQIVTNLLDNAVKYSSEHGYVELRLSVSDEEALVEVLDEGIGIAPAHRERIFERFYRVDKGRSREVGGTGLGLAIVKHGVQALGGRIELESELGSGSRFRVFLPLV